MAKEFVGNSANLYLLPRTEGKEGQERTVYRPMAEMILLSIEADYRLDDKGHIIKCTELYHDRLHIGLDNLDKYIEALRELREQMEAFGLQDEQQRAGVDPRQMSLPGV